jgi:hypothetical protein
VHYLHDQFWAESEGLAANEPQVYRDVRPHGVPEPVLDLRCVVDVVGGVPTVALAQDALAVLDPGHVRDVRAEEGPGRLRPDDCVATEVVNVGVRVEHEG